MFVRDGLAVLTLPPVHVTTPTSDVGVWGAPAIPPEVSRAAIITVGSACSTKSVPGFESKMAGGGGLLKL